MTVRAETNLMIARSESGGLNDIQFIAHLPESEIRSLPKNEQDAIGMMMMAVYKFERRAIMYTQMRLPGQKKEDRPVYTPWNLSEDVVTGWEGKQIKYLTEIVYDAAKKTYQLGVFMDDKDVPGFKKWAKSTLGDRIEFLNPSLPNSVEIKTDHKGLAFIVMAYFQNRIQSYVPLGSDQQLRDAVIDGGNLVKIYNSKYAPLWDKHKEINLQHERFVGRPVRPR